MRTVLTWAACAVFALCLVGTVAWPLWSDNDLWSFLFAIVAIAVMVPVVFHHPVRVFRTAFKDRRPEPERRS